MGRISSLADLPDDDILVWYIRQAMLIKGVPSAKPKAQSAKPATASATLTTPDYLAELLDQTPGAKKYFEKFSPSQKKEYVTWFEDAKSEATREKRLKEGLEWLSEGKTRHWKYK
ncbi:YdeI/OmpD-associated family protein [Mucilaginibacter gilvus]|uniref:YdeI/OmpD-associated family protein n=1 Tax=Mucilaginibacter gilvus TaxID=2305909 RepID=UPI001ABAAD7E|nr:YdeI/OmpD-associated family protein [Mucilaginibacter gilvus]